VARNLGTGMKKIDLGQAITIMANVGVIAGIIFLAFELRQNNELLASQARSNLVSGRATYQQYVATNDGGIAEIIVKVRDSALTPTERFRLNVHWALVINNWASMYQEVESGPLDEQDIPIRNWAGTFSANPDFRRRWDQLKVDHAPGFVRFIDETIIPYPID
jgi:hypothetical protein